MAENISPGGAFLKVDGNLEALSERVLAAIELPRGRELRVVGRIRWRRRGATPGVGIQFEQFLECGPPAAA